MANFNPFVDPSPFGQFFLPTLTARLFHESTTKEALSGEFTNWQQQLDAKRAKISNSVCAHPGVSAVRERGEQSHSSSANNEK
jgi:hypothetical protein